MAEANFGDFGATSSVPSGQMQRMVNLAGAGMSLALVIGVVVWGYHLVMRDVNGIPVIKAVEGPMRVAPEDPGGQISSNVGLTVNRIEANSSGKAQTGGIVLAPPAGGPAAGDLSAEAMAKQQAAKAAAAKAAAAQMARLAADAKRQHLNQSGVVPPQGSATTTASSSTAAPASATAGTVANTAAANTAAIARPKLRPAPPAHPSASISTGGDPFAAPAPTQAPTTNARTAATTPAPAATATQAQPAQVQAAPAQVAPPPTSPMAPALSMAPRMRPAVVPAVAAARPAAAKPAAPAPAVIPSTIAASQIPRGTHLVQVGAFLDRSQAVATWDALKVRFPDLMANKARVIQKSVSAGTPFYRLRAYGFGSRADTRRFCAAFDAVNANCVPVLVR